MQKKKNTRFYGEPAETTCLFFINDRGIRTNYIFDFCHGRSNHYVSNHGRKNQPYKTNKLQKKLTISNDEYGFSSNDLFRVRFDVFFFFSEMYTSASVYEPVENTHTTQ